MYRVQVWGDDVEESIDALPRTLALAFAEVRATLEVSPWTVGRPLVASNPSGSRTVEFGPGSFGLVLFGVIERERLATILQVSAF